MSNTIDTSKQLKSGKIVHGSRVMNRKEYGEAKGLRGAALKRAHKDYLASAYADRKAEIANDANLAIMRERTTDKTVTVTYAKLDAIKVSQPRASLKAENDALKASVAELTKQLAALGPVLAALKVA